MNLKGNKQDLSINNITKNQDLSINNITKNRKHPIEHLNSKLYLQFISILYYYTQIQQLHEYLPMKQQYTL